VTPAADETGCASGPADIARGVSAVGALRVVAAANPARRDGLVLPLGGVFYGDSLVHVSPLRSTVSRLLPVAFAVLPLACGPSASTGSGSGPSGGDAGPTAIELSEPKVVLDDPTAVSYEVKYRFTKGQPAAGRWYNCEIIVEGAGVGLKQMGGDEMNSEGVVKDGVRLPKPPTGSYQIKISEASSTGGPFRLASNVLSGRVK
jgi:hypothetical protein